MSGESPTKVINSFKPDERSIPFSNRISISQKITNNKEKERLKRLAKSIVPKGFGVILRTVAQDIKVAELDKDLQNTLKHWNNMCKQLPNARAPQKVLSEMNRASSILRDIFNDSFTSIITNDETLHQEVKEYLQRIAPDKESIAKLHKSRTPIFDHYGIEKQIKVLFGKTVSMKKGAYLVIEHTEALHVIDVNSGNRSNKANSQAETALEVNLIAATEIARQLQLRDMGGIIVVDFIDMHLAENRQRVFERMKENMALDSTKHNILPLSKFGLMQITRQRVRPEMKVEILEKCPTCMGTGEIVPSVLLTDQIRQNLNVIVDQQEEKQITLKVHPFVGAYINKGFWKTMRRKWQSELGIKLTIKEIPSYDLLGYKFFDRNNQEIKY